MSQFINFSFKDRARPISPAFPHACFLAKKEALEHTAKTLADGQPAQK